MDCGLYRPVLRHAGQELLGQVFRGVLLGSVCFAIVLFFQPKILLPRSIVVMGPIFGLLSLISMRLIFRWIIRVHLLGLTNRVRNSVAIYGAGAAGLELYESLLHQRTYLVRVFVDDDLKLQGRQLRGIPSFRLHPLKDQRKLRFAMGVSGNPQGFSSTSKGNPCKIAALANWGEGAADNVSTSQ